MRARGGSAQPTGAARLLLTGPAVLAGLAGLAFASFASLALAQDPPAPAGWVSASAASSGRTAEPKGRIVLTLSGKLKRPNAQDRAVFDMAMLAALPQHSFKTKTPWYAEPRKFTGPLLRDVLAAAGADGKSLEAIAINDYKVSIPVEDALKHPVIVARLIDDQAMPLRDKGPLFIIYPFDTAPELRSSLFYSRSVWQLKALVIR